METFSPNSAASLADVAIVPLDKAAGSPVWKVPPTYDGVNVNGVATLAAFDFDGSELTGTDRLYAMGAYNVDGEENPVGVLDGKQLKDGGYTKVVIPVTEAQALAGEDIPVSFPQSSKPAGTLRLALFTSDGTP